VYTQSLPIEWCEHGVLLRRRFLSADFKKSADVVQLSQLFRPLVKSLEHFLNVFQVLVNKCLRLVQNQEFDARQEVLIYFFSHIVRFAVNFMTT